jgi:multiple sugar transport system ATP-binding protein
VPKGSGGTDGQRIVYGVRPEHLSLGPAGSADALAARVVVVEPTGMDTQVFAKFGEVELTAVFRERHEFVAGAQVVLAPDHARTHLFDAESGRSLMQK